jgi:hypothetical protein
MNNESEPLEIQDIDEEELEHLLEDEMEDEVADLPVSDSELINKLRLSDSLPVSEVRLSELELLMTPKHEPVSNMKQSELKFASFKRVSEPSNSSVVSASKIEVDKSNERYIILIDMDAYYA